MPSSILVSCDAVATRLRPPNPVSCDAVATLLHLVIHSVAIPSLPQTLQTMQTLANLITHISLNMPELSYVDEDYGQLEALQQPDTDTYPLTFPAVLINTEGVDWSPIADGAQTGVGTVRVRLLIDCYDDMHAGSGTTNKAADRQAVVHRLHTILEGHRPNEEGALTRTSSKSMVGFQGIKIYDQFYTYSAKEFTQMKETAPIRTITLKASRI